VSALKKYAFSVNVDTYFCPTCGTLIFFNDKKKETCYVAIGALNEGSWEFKDHICVEDTKDGGCSNWLRSVGNKTLKRWRNIDDVQWIDEGQKKYTREEKDELRVHCLCKGIDFRITQPTAESGKSLTHYLQSSSLKHP